MATIVLLAFSFVLGGASRQHELRLAIIELVALSAAVFAIARFSDPGAPRPSKLAFGLLVGLLALPLVQLIPLPPAVWTSLPGRQELETALGIAGLNPDWAPLTLTPDRTWRSFLALLPPAAMFLGVIANGNTIRTPLVWAFLGLTFLALLLGIAQLASGGNRLYPWATTDAGNFSGFFANRNHMATLCLMALPFATVMGVGMMKAKRQRDHFLMWAMVLLIVLTVVSLGVIRSRAGILLATPVLAASLAGAWIATGRGRPKPALLAFGASATVGLLTVVVFALGPLLQRFDRTGIREGRFENLPLIGQAVETYLPVGSGLGSFDSVFRSIEPLAQLDPTFFNQAHNDYLETVLETGWFGAALIVVFFVWFIRRAWAAWRSGPSRSADLQRAATIAIGAVLLHSAADYPLRTVALATIFAMCCALLELPRLVESRHRVTRTRH